MTVSHSPMPQRTSPSSICACISRTCRAARTDCEWFEEGEATIPQMQELVKQFSVFSNLFLLAQLNKIINAPTLDEMREGKEILANEIGVVFKPKSKKTKEVAGQFDPSIVSTSGTVEGGVYSNRAAHFEWLCDVGRSIGLGFEDLGKRRHGTEATLHFCDKLYEIYGSEDLSVSLGASFAIEHWANAGFWDSLVAGFEKANKRDGPGVVLDDGTVSHKTPLGFWKFHQALEAQHADHTMEELEEAYAAGRILDEAAFEQVSASRTQHPAQPQPSHSKPTSLYCTTLPRSERITRLLSTAASFDRQQKWCR